MTNNGTIRDLFRAGLYATAATARQESITGIPIFGVDRVQIIADWKNAVGPNEDVDLEKK